MNSSRYELFVDLLFFFFVIGILMYLAGCSTTSGNLTDCSNFCMNPRTSSFLKDGLSCRCEKNADID